MSSWFTDLEDVAYSIVEYIPLVGTVYSFKRANIAYNEQDWTRHWQSVGNFLESLTRDVILFSEIAEPIEAALLHTMAESFTDKLIEIYHKSNKPEIQITKKLDKQSGHVLVAESSEGKYKRQVFEDKAKGVHHFHGAAFTGTLTDEIYAPNGTEIWLNVPHGLYDRAPISLSWKWTHEYDEVKVTPMGMLGRIQLVAGTPTRFQLFCRKEDGEWKEYDFWGDVNSIDQITATTQMEGREIEIDFTRVSGT